MSSFTWGSLEDTRKGSTSFCALLSFPARFTSWPEYFWEPIPNTGEVRWPSHFRQWRAVMIIIDRHWTSFRCELPFEADGANYSLPLSVKNVSIPRDEFSGKWSMCSMYDANYTKEYFTVGIPANKTKHCEKWIFDKTKYKSSSVIEVRNIINCVIASRMQSC